MDWEFNPPVISTSAVAKTATMAIKASSLIDFPTPFNVTNPPFLVKLSLNGN
jgi:hypothetical protein